MYGSYGSPSSTSSSYSSSSFTSYRSYSSMSSPMDIAPSPFSTRGPDASCAFPSWPRRTSLCEYDASEERATSYISDEDLFPQDFEDDARSESSHGSASPFQSPPPAAALTEANILEMQRERAAYQREVIKLLLSEKERRRQQAKRRTSSSSKKAKSKLTAMTPIAEAD